MPFSRFFQHRFENSIGVIDRLDRCLAPDPGKRFPNVQAVLNALDARAMRRARLGDVPTGAAMNAEIQSPLRSPHATPNRPRQGDSRATGVVHGSRVGAENPAPAPPPRKPDFWVRSKVFLSHLMTSRCRQLNTNRG